MWPNLADTRRRLMGTSASPAGSNPVEGWPGGPARPTADEPGPAALAEIVLSVGRADLERLGGALQAALGPDAVRPDTPARLEAALGEIVARLGGAGQLRVTRRPAGLYTPESWQVRLTSVEPRVGDAIRMAMRDGVFAG